TFSDGQEFHIALINKPTVLAFDNTGQKFKLTSASVVNGQATGDSSFDGGCRLAIATGSGYPAGTGPQSGTITLNPCTFDSSSNTLTVTNGSITASVSCTVSTTAF